MTSDEKSQATLTVFTAEQIQKLLSLIEMSKSGYEKLSGNEKWILDSGASRHRTGNLKALTNWKKLKQFL